MTTHPMHAGRVHHNLQAPLWWDKTTEPQLALWCSRPGCMRWMEPQDSGQPFGGVKPQGSHSPLWCSRPGCMGWVEPQSPGSHLVG